MILLQSGTRSMHYSYNHPELKICLIRALMPVNHPRIQSLSGSNKLSVPEQTCYLNAGAGGWAPAPSEGGGRWRVAPVWTCSCHLAASAPWTQTSSWATAGPARCTSLPPPAGGDRDHAASAAAAALCSKNTVQPSTKTHDTTTTISGYTFQFHHLSR